VTAVDNSSATINGEKLVVVPQMILAVVFTLVVYSLDHITIPSFLTLIRKGLILFL